MTPIPSLMSMLRNCSIAFGGEKVPAGCANIHNGSETARPTRLCP